MNTTESIPSNETVYEKALKAIDSVERVVSEKRSQEHDQRIGIDMESFIDILRDIKNVSSDKVREVGTQIEVIENGLECAITAEKPWIQKDNGINNIYAKRTGEDFSNTYELQTTKEGELILSVSRIDNKGREGGTFYHEYNLGE